jgi:hypothetical protein
MELYTIVLLHCGKKLADKWRSSLPKTESKPKIEFLAAFIAATINKVKSNGFIMVNEEEE